MFKERIDLLRKLKKRKVQKQKKVRRRAKWVPMEELISECL